tara:strand:- start:1957 stop:2637 length:681 start_codon:yes stop_codon:yes gene_type:complete
MAYSAPNSFSTGNKINGSQVEQNIDVLQSYVNGGISSVDINPQSGHEFGFKHVMKGEYFPINNSYEFATGINQGTLGNNNAGGYAADIIGDFKASGTGIDFYLEEDADVYIHITCYPRTMSSLNAAQVGLSSRTTTMAVRKTSEIASKAVSTSAFMTESEFGVGNGASNDGGIQGLERRRPAGFFFSGYHAAGEHKYRLQVNTNDRSTALFFYQINVYAYYRPTTV